MDSLNNVYSDRSEYSSDSGYESSSSEESSSPEPQSSFSFSKRDIRNSEKKQQTIRRVKIHQVDIIKVDELRERLRNLREENEEEEKRPVYAELQSEPGTPVRAPNEVDEEIRREFAELLLPSPERKEEGVRLDVVQGEQLPSDRENPLNGLRRQFEGLISDLLRRG